ncbi:transposase [Orientia tsutsugamushi]|nr:transposase [Orientia tsutsugamushi]
MSPLNKRHSIETINDQLKHLCHINHTHNRSFMYFNTNALSGLLAYVFKPNKISVSFSSLNHLSLSLPCLWSTNYLELW